jgi:hypothetical protein
MSPGSLLIATGMTANPESAMHYGSAHYGFARAEQSSSLQQRRRGTVRCLYLCVATRLDCHAAYLSVNVGYVTAAELSCRSATLRDRTENECRYQQGAWDGERAGCPVMGVGSLSGRDITWGPLVRRIDMFKILRIYQMFTVALKLI